MLSVSHIDVFYGDLQALWDVSFTVEEGRIVTLIGGNGTGKSTVLKTVSGLLKPARGAVRLQGSAVEKMPPHKMVQLGVSMVPEGRRVFPEMSVLENLEMGAFVDRARKARENTLEWVHSIFPVLRPRAHQLAGTLSGGEQQMLAIGRALMSLPKLLLLDEMSLGLAPVVVDGLSETVKEINRSRSITVLLVEQNVRVALELADQAYVLENGRIVSHGPSADLLSSASIRGAYLGL
ncbi:MAG: ABC transporter ATP-binding protein [Deltaproteobacteria bacterium HGW-Deltaproteobacteria-21]|nr:MAG: ABC transporter ATP-binding protein [Deltaproteobacteria bacterium HGW-Deltaproteobacteria-21]